MTETTNSQGVGRLPAPEEELATLMTLGGEFVRAVATRSRVVAPKAIRAGRRAAGAPTTYVVDRHGAKVAVRFDMITERNEDLRSNPEYGPELAAIDSPAITADVVRRFRNGMTTRELDSETAAICIALSTHHSDNEWLAARIYVSDLHKRTPAGLGAMVEALAAAAPDPASLRISPELIGIIRDHGRAIDARLANGRDYRLRYFGYQTLSRSYLLRPVPRRGESTLLDAALMERPQHLYMRVALGIFATKSWLDLAGLRLWSDAAAAEKHWAEETVRERLEDAFEFYDALSLQRVSNATPTMLNAGTNVPQLSSCFQLATGDDLPSLFDTVKAAALISKWSGGISLWLHNVRAAGAPIRKTGGVSSGIMRYIKILNEVQLYVDQGGNRPGAFAVYLSLDHDDLFTFLAMARPKGEEAIKSLNAPKLKYALWVPDLFMEALVAQLENEERVARGGADDPTAGDWYLFSPDAAPGLHLAYGDEYRDLVRKYVAEGRHRRCVKVKDVMAEVFKTWSQVSTPYWQYKDHINRKSNMKNVGPICSGNLCTEIDIPSWSEFDAAEFGRFHPDNAAGGEFGVCNLAAICLESFLADVWTPDMGVAGPGMPLALDFAGIMRDTALEVRALNRVIDLNYYPSPECARGNRRHRPIGIGIMGLADVFARLGLAYGSDESRKLARQISAAIYYSAMDESVNLAVKHGAYDSFPGSPLSEGKLQPDLWVETGHLAPGWEHETGVVTPAMWAALRARARKHGARNAYVTAYMPTATTSNIVGQNECFEPFTSNIYTRLTLAGEFFVVNRHLMAELIELDLWDEPMRRAILGAGGSVQKIERIPADVRKRYRTAREIPPGSIIKMAKAMAPFICQAMSMNMYIDDPNLPKILRFLLEGWRAGLKSGLYYCHTKPAAGSQQTSIQGAVDGQAGAPAAEAPVATEAEGEACFRGKDGCVSCNL